MIIFKAIFHDVDYPSRDSFEQLFKKKIDAIQYVNELAKDHDINIMSCKWKTHGDTTFFNYQFNDHKTQDNACYHGSIEEVEVL